MLQKKRGASGFVGEKTKCGVAWIGVAGIAEHFGHERLKADRVREDHAPYRTKGEIRVYE
jgi:hypothetical protein